MVRYCVKCDEDKAIEEFKKHSNGNFRNVCVTCTNKQRRLRHAKRMDTDSKYKNALKEKQRRRYHKIKYTGAFGLKLKIQHKRFPWKASSTYKQLNRKFPLPKGIERHHWNYSPEFIEDFIPINRISHRRFHKFIIHEDLIFKTQDGRILDSKEKHINYMKELGFEPFVKKQS